MNDLESVVKEADMASFMSGTFSRDVCEQASHLFVCRLRDLWGTIQGHSWYYGVKDTLCVSELLRVPKFFCHPGECFVLCCLLGNYLCGVGFIGGISCLFYSLIC